jgi:hypothetical protein
MTLLKYIPLIELVLIFIILAISIYPFVTKYYKRPKIVLGPHYWSPEQNVKLLGFKVKNVGRAIAERVYGEVQYNGSAKTRIFWNSSLKDEIDMLPESLDEYWFYVAKLKKVNGFIERYRGCYIWSSAMKERYEIIIKLFWDYHGLKSLTKRFLLDLTEWDKSRIIPIK